LPEERERIEKSGLAVIQQVVKEEDLILHKIMLDDQTLSMLRAFGDFEYKANGSLGPES
jgi:Protein phosphatase 2C